jgi:RNA polymerase sigma factor (sigma-70 family)
LAPGATAPTFSAMSPRESDLSTALEALLDRYSSTVRRLARQRGLQEHEVDEVFQEVRIRLWKALGEKERIETVKASYVHRATMSAALDLIRQRREKEQPLGAVEMRGSSQGNPVAVAAPVHGPEAELARGRIRDALAAALEALPERRQVPVRMHLLGYGTLETAKILGWSEPTARNLLHRGLADLRRELLDRGVHPPGSKRSAG